MTSRAAPFDIATRPLWITRDSFEGALAEEVDVWTSNPDRVTDDGRALWLPAGIICTDDMVATPEGRDAVSLDIATRMDADHAVSLPLETARIVLGESMPATDRECIRYG